MMLSNRDLKSYVKSLIVLLIFALPACSKSRPIKPNGFWHTWQSGDTLEQISTRYSSSSLVIQRTNHIYDPLDLSTGMRIFIPTSKKNPTKEVPRFNTTNQDRYSFIWPAAGTISSGFGLRHGKMHEGIDITRDKGLNIMAVGNGIVEYSGPKSGYGKTIIINHGKGFKTLYAHNSRLYVKKSMKIKTGTIIAQMGSSGKVTGPHLHFEIKLNGKAKNPLRFLPIR